MTRLEAGRLELRREEVDLVALTRDTVAQSAIFAGDRQIRLEAPVHAVTGEWDGDRLAQVLTNLLDNALKYAPEGEIVVRITSQPEEMHVAVRDLGPGLTPAELRRVFDHFYRGSHGSAAAKGAGLGLFISKSIVEAHGGRLWADSTPGEGTTFTFALPHGFGAREGADGSAVAP
jgi:signal transduction histidine kinase